MNVETLLAISIVLLYWSVTLLAYLQEKRVYKSRMQANGAPTKGALQWVMKKLHLPREKFVNNKLEEKT